MNIPTRRSYLTETAGDWRHWALLLLLCFSTKQATATDALASGGYECLLSDGGRVQASGPLHQVFPLTFSSCHKTALTPTRLAARRLLHPEPIALPVRPERPLHTYSRTERRQLQAPVQTQFASLIHLAAEKHGLDPALVAAVVHVESRGRPNARSPKGALGLMQIIPATGRRYGVESEEKLFDPRTNLQTGSRYLRDLLRMFDGRLDLALAAYNAGEGAVMRHGWAIPPFAETRSYVDQVLRYYEASSSAQ